MFGAAAMSLSSFCVVTNALRLNLFKIHNASHDKKMKSNPKRGHEDQKEDSIMEKTIIINGMMCGHCEATVKKALEALTEVDEAIVSHIEGTAIVKLNADIDNAVLTTTVEKHDFAVIEIE